jgi:hypothetical protein
MLSYVVSCNFSLSVLLFLLGLALFWFNMISLAWRFHFELGDLKEHFDSLRIDLEEYEDKWAK